MEQEMARRLSELEAELEDVKSRRATLKNKLIKVEDELVAIMIKKENAEEQLRVFKLHHDVIEETLVDLDIKRFKEILPELIEKLKDEDAR